MFQPTEEQLEFIAAVLQGHNVLVDACVGSGKTTAIQMLCDAYPGKDKILYLTYNKLLKLDAKAKIKKKNVTVTNYHGFAYTCLKRINVNAGIPDLIQQFNKLRPPIARYGLLVIDEYQDIELEFAEMLKYIKEANPGIQIAAVGDMQQKVYDKTTLDVSGFIKEFLEEHDTLNFTKCFRLPPAHAEMLGRIWNKRIEGVNTECEVLHMKENEVVDFLAGHSPPDVLCLGSRNGALAKALNELERRFPDIYNKKTVFASISDNDSFGSVSPTPETAIFTTYDSSKGLERKTVVLFDFTEGYWEVRRKKPQQSYEILRNIFCVAASRGKGFIVFVDTGEPLLSEETLSTPKNVDTKQKDMEFSELFEFKFKEDVETCFSLISAEKIPTEDSSIIYVNNKDGMIDLSPCIGIYQEASYFDGYDIDKSILIHHIINRRNERPSMEELNAMSVEEKTLLLTYLETNQERYIKQVEIPFIQEDEKEAIHRRLGTVFGKNENVQKVCAIHFSDSRGEPMFSALGMADVVKDGLVYELKFVHELTHEHFLQCACYTLAMNFEKGILWNVRTNDMYAVTVPEKNKFLDAVAKTATKGVLKKYHKPSAASIKAYVLKSAMLEKAKEYIWKVSQ